MIKLRDPLVDEAHKKIGEAVSILESVRIETLTLMDQFFALEVVLDNLVDDLERADLERVEQHLSFYPTASRVAIERATKIIEKLNEAKSKAEESLRLIERVKEQLKI